MAFKMKASAEGPFKKNFPSAFKTETNLPEEEQTRINKKKARELAKKAATDFDRENFYTLHYSTDRDPSHPDYIKHED